ncbi:MAG: MBL fold metallo-hydrolase [Pseudomonadota bacterium]
MTVFDPQYGALVPLAHKVARVTAPNKGPFTGAGTNTYILGDRTVMVVDPGPANTDHLDALMKAIGGRPVSHILITHTHNDHVGGLEAFQSAVTAPTAAEGPHRTARPLKAGETNPFQSSSDVNFVPDIALADGDEVDNGDVTVTAIATPGHTANHLAFSIGEGCLTGDHVMGWSTTVIAPPDGSMADYLTSLDTLSRHRHAVYWPAHGDKIADPEKVVSAMRSHRLMRERAIMECLSRGETTIPPIVETLYGKIDARLKPAAGLSVLAQLEKLESEGRAASQGLGATALWRLT